MHKERLKALVTACYSGFHRFAITIFWLTLLTICMLLNSHQVFGDSDISWYLFLGLVNTALLSLILNMTLSPAVSTWGKYLAHFACCILAAGFSLYLYFLKAPDAIAVPLVLSIEFILASLFFIVPFLRCPNDLPLRHFLLRMIAGAVISVIVAGVLTGGIELLVMFISMLFQCDIPFTLERDIAIIGAFWVLPVVFLQFIPDTSRLQDADSQPLTGTLRGVTHYVLIPLLIGYILTLYVYGVSILFRWQLPDGLVAWPVSIVMALIIVVYVLILPSEFRTEKSLSRILLRWMPVVALPLLLLMSVAVGRRLSDYGVSVPRLYLLAFNIWCYVLCLLMMIRSTRQRILTLGLSTFALLFLLISVGPWSFSRSVERHYRNYVEQTLRAARMKPSNIDKSHLNILTENMKNADRDLFMTRLQILDSDYDRQGMEKWFTEDAWTLVASYEVKEEASSVLTSSNLSPYSIYDIDLSIPAGFHKVRCISYVSATVIRADSLSFVLNVDLQGKKRDFLFDRKHCIPVKEDEREMYLIWGTTDGAELCILTDRSHVSVSRNDKVSFNGWLFTK